MTNDLALQPQISGAGSFVATAGGVRLSNGPTSATQYTNAQIDDYQGLARHRFPWSPPLRLTLQARFSHPADQLRGTAGFGFWNEPFLATGQRFPTLPRALWFFFSSPPSNMRLALDVPGPGWKAATIDAWRWQFFCLAPTAPVAMLLMRIRPFYRWLWPVGQRAIGVCEALLPIDLTQWRRYTIEWGAHDARFLVDDTVVLACDRAPGGPLGLVIWKDNQAMTVTPWRLPHQELVTCADEQWLEVQEVEIGT
jgi:hypothetical protein